MSLACWQTRVTRAVEQYVRTTAGLDSHCPTSCHTNSVSVSSRSCLFPGYGDSKIRSGVAAVDSVAVLCWRQHEASSRRRTPLMRAERSIARRAMLEHSDDLIAFQTRLSATSELRPASHPSVRLSLFYLRASRVSRPDMLLHFTHQKTGTLLVDRPSSNKPRIGDLHQPSWSGASYTGGFGFQSQLGDLLFRILVSVVLLSPPRQILGQ
jgi:hypothetical protein